MATTILGQNAITLPVGTTGDRPTGAQAMLRYNTGTKAIEYFNSTLNDWVGVGIFTATSTGSVTSITGYKVHTFTSSGTFTTGIFGGAVQVLIVGAGGGAGADVGGGGGGGGCLYSGSLSLSPNTAYSVTVGSGITGNINGNPSTFGGLTAYGGGWGGNWQGNPGNPGGCGGGGSGYNAANVSAFGAGSGTPGQGYPGASGQTGSSFEPSNANGIGGGGGGGGGAGSGANGGVGYQSSINGTATYYGGGGGGATDGGSVVGTGGSGGGGPGNSNGTYYGGAAGGTSGSAPSYSSYQGIVIIRYTA